LPEFEYDDVLAGLRLAYDAKVQERDAHDVEPWKDAERARFLALLRAESRRTLVDVGAGTGVHAAFFRDGGLEVSCVDASPAMVARCRERGLPAYDQDVLHLDLPARFDGAFAMNSLLHTPPADLPRALRRIRNVLEPGGVFYLGQYGGVTFEGPWLDDSYDPPRYFSRLTDAELHRVAAEVFTVDDFRAVDIGVPADFGHFQALVLRRGSGACFGS
jgi:SAM-dependent methyltransferase